MYTALRELISPLYLSVDSLSDQLSRGVTEINTQISGTQGQMLSAEKNFQTLQNAHTELAKTTQANFECMRQVQEQALQHIVQDSEVQVGRAKEEMLGFIQAVKDEIAEMKVEKEDGIW